MARVPSFLAALVFVAGALAGPGPGELGFLPAVREQAARAYEWGAARPFTLEGEETADRIDQVLARGDDGLRAFVAEQDYTPVAAVLAPWVASRQQLQEKRELNAALQASLAREEAALLPPLPAGAVGAAGEVAPSSRPARDQAALVEPAGGPLGQGEAGEVSAGGLAVPLEDSFERERRELAAEAARLEAAEAAIETRIRGLVREHGVVHAVILIQQRDTVGQAHRAALRGEAPETVRRVLAEAHGKARARAAAWVAAVRREGLGTSLDQTLRYYREPKSVSRMTFGRAS